MTILEILNDLASDNSRNAKIAKLKVQHDNQLLKSVIVAALDPFVNYYIRKIPKYEATSGPVASLCWALTELKKLSSRELTGNLGIAHLSTILSSLDAGDAEVIKRVIGKDLKCGASTSTVNTIWPELIHEYPCMLCSAHDEKLVKKIRFPAFVQCKEDGMRVNAIVRNGKCEFRSRNGKLLDLLGNLEAELIEMSGTTDVVFDGELLVHVDGVIADRQTGNGVLNKSVKGTISAKEAAQVHIHLWDRIDYADFVAGKSGQAYDERWERLTDCMNIAFAKVHAVECQVVNDLSEVQPIFKKYLARGLEGIILKDMKSIWEDKRSKSQIKFKAIEECDLKVVGIQMGTGKYEGMIGALLCESSDGILKADVGTGLKDEDRKKAHSEYLGKIVAVKYNMRIRNKQGEESLFLPVLVECREDKDVADSINSIK